MKGATVTEAKPKPNMTGRFALYETPDGGRLLAYVTDGETEQHQVVIPAPLIKMMEAKQRGESVNPFSLFKMFAGG